MSFVPQWKEEPVSPRSTSSVNLDELSAFDDSSLYNQTSFDEKFHNDLLACESKAEVASYILENLENLVDLDELIKEEPFLLDEKLLLLEDTLDPQNHGVSYTDVKAEAAKPQTPLTQYLNEFNTTFYDIPTIPNGTLTPPQSPPTPAIQLVLEPVSAVYSMPADKTIFAIPDKSDVAVYSVDFQVNTPQPDIAHELAVVDELVRTRVEDMERIEDTPQWINGPSSPDTNSSFSSSGNSSLDYTSDDPEWMPESLNQSVVEDCSSNLKAKSGTRKRLKPYNAEDRKCRKKEQNKNAATRYRMKKKAEVEVILSEEKTLQDMNDGVKGKITDLEREIKYLKGLMRDLFKAKGLIQ